MIFGHKLIACVNGHAIPQEYYICPHVIEIMCLISVIISLICCFACMEASESCLAVSCIPMMLVCAIKQRVETLECVPEC